MCWFGRGGGAGVVAVGGAVAVWWCGRGGSWWWCDRGGEVTMRWNYTCTPVYVVWLFCIEQSLLMCCSAGIMYICHVLYFVFDRLSVMSMRHNQMVLCSNYSVFATYSITYCLTVIGRCTSF